MELVKIPNPRGGFLISVYFPALKEGRFGANSSPPSPNLLGRAGAVATPR